MKNIFAGYEDALAIFVKLSVWIGAPIIPAVFLGSWLDNKFNSKPWLFLATVITAFLISMFGLIKETTIFLAKISQESNKKDLKKSLKKE